MAESIQQIGQDQSSLLRPLYPQWDAGILIPNIFYEHELRYSTKWFISGFIAGFAAVVQHGAHITTPKYKNSDRVLMVLTPYPNNPVNEIIPFGDMTHFVSVV